MPTMQPSRKCPGLTPTPKMSRRWSLPCSTKNEVEASVPNVRSFFKDLVNELGDEGAGVGGLG